MKEEWKNINGYEGLYQISNLGRVRSLDRDVVCKNGVVRHLKGRLLKVVKDTSGYYRVVLWKNSYSLTYNVHRLVLEAFNPIENPQRFEADHLNHDISDNRLENLRWLTPTENNTRPKKGKRVGQYDEDGLIEVFASIREAERKTGINHSHICKCCKGKRRTAGGFVWKYYNNE